MAAKTSELAQDLTIVDRGKLLIHAVRSIERRRGVVRIGVLDVLAQESDGSITQQKLRAAGMTTVKRAVQNGCAEHRAIQLMASRSQMIVGSVVVVRIV